MSENADKEETKMGRPLAFNSPEELQEKIDAYFEHIDSLTDDNDKKVPYTVAGLGLWLDVDTETIRNYEKKDDFFGTIKRAKQKIEEQLETKLQSNNVAGVIFNLKNNYGWKDKKEVGLDANVNITGVEIAVRKNES